MRRFIRPTLIAALSLALTSAIFAYATNYTLTQGSGTTFGSIVVGGVNYAQHMLCDLTTPSQCAAVSAAGAVKVDSSAVTQPVSAASLPLPTGAATSANQATEISSLTTIATNTGAAVPAGTNVIGKVGIDQTTFGTTNGVVSAAVNYQEVAASQTATVLQTSTGATGDYLSHCIIYPASTSPGVVTVFDNTNSAANNVIQFPGGASSTSNLVPFVIAVGAKSVNGAWKVTTGANVAVVCVGKFS